MHRAIATPRVRKYHVAEDPESFEEYDMHPPQIPNPRVPYVRHDCQIHLPVLISWL